MLLFFGQIPPGADPGRGLNRHGGPLLQETSSSDWKATATNRMHSNDLKACGKKCCYFWFFDVSLDFVILPYFDAISMDFYAVKCLIYIYFVWFPCLYVEKCLYKRFKWFMNFNEFSMYLFRWKRGGVALIHVYVWEHIVSLYYRTA